MASATSIPPTRRLSAIMFTDIVGYSAMTQKDEANALRLLSEHNALLRPLFTRHHGNEIKTIGDAFLVEFSSALDAVQCAIGIQDAIKERNEHESPDNRFEIRIGVHLGDVVHEEGDVFGDGVNIASRIYPVAAPGGICISSSVAQQVQNKIDHEIRKLPSQALKNIAIQIDLFEIILPGVSAAGVTPLISPRSFRQIRIATLGIAGVFFAAWLYTQFTSIATYPMNRVAVLPLRNISQSAEHEYFAEGMTEELISSLSRISGLEVIARSSVIQYQEASIDFGVIGEKLRAGALVEGSVRHFGDSVRVTVRLVDASSERLLWDEDYNRPAANALKIQDDIALNVAGALRVQLLDAERQDLTDEREHDPDAWRLYLLGRYHLNKRTSENVIKSMEYFRRSTHADSTFAPAYSGLAESNLLIGGAGYGNTPREKALSDAIDAADRAIVLDPHSAEAFAVRAYIMYRLLWNWQDADSLFRQAIRIKPSYARGHEWFGLYLALRGRTKEGLAEMQKAASLDPHSPSVATGVGRLLAFDGQYTESIAQLENVVRDHPDYPEAYFALALSYAYDTQYETSFRYFAKAIELSGRRYVILADYTFYLAKVGRTQEARVLLAELDSLSQYQQGGKQFRGIIRLALGEEDEGYDLLEEAVDEKDGLLIYLRADPFVREFMDHPRFRNIEKKIWGED